MPTELGQEYKPWEIVDPPQMLPEDWIIWHKFRKIFGEIFERFYYNVRVGGQDIQDPAIPEPIRKSWYYSTAKRIDAVGETKDEVWIIEVAANPGLRAMGQIMTYQSLWALDPKINKKGVAVLVVDRIEQDLQFACSVQGVRVMEV